MNAHKKILMVYRERIRMTHSRFLTIIAFVLIAGMLALLAAPVECAEIYTSANSTYPRQLENQSQSCYYRTARMDTVYFAGREVVFFTLESDCIVTRALYYYTPGYSTYGNVILFDSQLPNGDPYFKTVVFNNILYIFYSYGNTIYYRTVTVDYGTDGTGWNLTFSDQKSLPGTGISYAKIRSAVVMNGKLYIIYSDYNYNASGRYDGPDWYYFSSTDGLTFGSGTKFFTSPVNTTTEWEADAAVFIVPDASQGFEEKLMIVYAPGGSRIYYFFFNGEVQYGHWYEDTGISEVRSVRLFAGTAEGYTKNTYVIQVFCATPTGSDSKWVNMYHGEYTPSGLSGDSGKWNPTWTQLSLSDSDAAYQLYEPNWAIIPYFKDEDANQRMNLRIWYSKGSEYHYKAFGNGYDTIEFRYSTYKSDLLVHADDTPPTPQEPGMSSYPVVGVIAGTPPYPINNGVPTADSANTSTVVLETSQSITFSTIWTATAGTAVSYKRKFGPVEAQAKLSAGVKRSKESTTGKATYQTDTLRSYNYLSHPGGLAWVLFLKPEFLIDQYILKDYDGNPLAYDGDTDELRVSLITYGPNTTLGKKAFYLDNPSAPMGGTDTSTKIFEGMAPMPLSTNVDAWSEPVTSTNAYKIFMQLPSFSSTQGDQSSTKYVETATNAVTNGWNAGFSTSASLFGFTVEGNINYSMDFKTTTSMTQSLGFGYAVPACGPPNSTTSCISDMTVYPYLLVPNDDDTGYNAPWITDDMFYFKKPKPWCITYWVPSPPSAATNLAATRIAVQKIQGGLFFDEGKPDRDKLSAIISLLVPRDFVMNKDEWLHLRLGNCFLDSKLIEVISRQFDGNNLVLKLKGLNSDSSITVSLSYNRKSSVLDINLDADRIDLTPLYSYKFLGAEKPTDGETDFGLYLGDKYFAKGDLEVHCAIPEIPEKANCYFHTK